MTSRWHHRRPPWWPDNEPWPPIGAAAHWQRGRGRFMRRMGFFVAGWLVLAVIGAITVLAWLTRGHVDVSHLPPVVLNWAPLVVMLIAPLLIAAMVAAVFFTVMTRVGRPFGDIVSAANQVGGGNFSVRVAEGGPPFLRALGRAFNTMAGRLHAQDQQRRQLMEDVAHELRTPLAIMRGRVEGMADGVYRSEEGLKDLLEQTQTLERLIADLATLSSAEGGSLTLEKESTDLGSFVDDVAASMRPVAGRAGLTLDVGAGSNVSIDIDRIRIREVLTNLIVNAIQHTPGGGGVTLRARQNGANALIEVVDSGRGISPEDLDHIFDRFRKGPDSRGSGLGLAIARQLVLAHGGTIQAASTPGTGTTMTVTLPLDAR